MKAVGNAVPMLFGWAVLGSVFEAAYGTAAPKPACLDGRPPWEGGSADTPHMRISTIFRLCHGICHIPISSVPSNPLPERRAVVLRTSLALQESLSPTARLVYRVQFTLLMVHSMQCLRSML